MTISYHERPGVYSDFTASGIYGTNEGGKTVALAAAFEGPPGVHVLRSAADAAEYSGFWPLDAVLRLLFRNGAGKVLLCPVSGSTADAYAAAIQALIACREARVILTDSADAGVAAVLKTAVETASRDRNECVGVVCPGSGTDADRIAAAAALNSARILMAAPACYCDEDEAARPIYTAAAMAGMLAGQSDPSLPLHGAIPEGLTAISGSWTEDAIDALIRGGVTPLEYVDGAVRVVRAVSTKTTENGQPDATWKEITTILIVDDVISGVRSSLQRRFQRAKNNVQTRAAIRDQVVLELETRIRRQIIEQYGDLTVTANADDPSVCDVVFSFGVAHGLRCILLSAHITV